MEINILKAILLFTTLCIFVFYLSLHWDEGLKTGNLFVLECTVFCINGLRNTINKIETELWKQ